MDSFCKSMDLYRIVVKNPDSKKIRFVSWLPNLTSSGSGFASPILKDSDSWIQFGTHFSKIRPVFTNPTNPYESVWILTNPYESLVYRRTLNKPESVWILGFGFTNPYCFQKIHFVDLFHPMVFKKFVLWIWIVLRCSKDSFCGFVSELFFQIYSIRFDLEGFVYESCRLNFETLTNNTSSFGLDKPIVRNMDCQKCGLSKT